MSRATDQYQLWISDPDFDEATRTELLSICGDHEEIEDRFYQDLAFGTAGLRGIIGAGTNRMNRYTVARAAEGFARFLEGQDERRRSRGVVISYDPRHFSRDFAWQTASIFIGHGIRVYLSDEMRPVPMLSFAIRRYRAIAGVMITASHNPAEYNGFKAYGEDGGQLPPDEADIVSRSMDEITDLPRISWPDEEAVRASGLLSMIGSEWDDAYIAMLKNLSLAEDSVRRQRDMIIVYTPLHGTGNKPVRRILEEVGFSNVLVVSEQERPDPAFSTVAYPNPEERSALELAIRLAEKADADLVIATDPDADRTGLCVRTREGEYVVLSGNQIGQLLMEFILSSRKAAGNLPPDSFCITTIVSSKLTRRIAAAYGVRLFECLTGFKYIAELIKEHDEDGHMHFIFGFEESFGYLAGLDVRDKDAIVTSMLIAQMAAESKDHGQTLYDRLEALYGKYGHASEKTTAITLEGKEGLERIKACMSTLRQKKETLFPELPIRVLNDYLMKVRFDLLTGETTRLDLAESDVLLFELPGYDWFCARPSGTEPKLKIYFGIYRDQKNESDRDLIELCDIVESRIKSML